MLGAMSIHAYMCVLVCVACSSWTRNQVMCLEAAYHTLAITGAMQQLPKHNKYHSVYSFVWRPSLSQHAPQNPVRSFDANMLAESRVFLMQRFQSKDMDDKIKCYRQAVLKLDHVKRKTDEDFACASLPANSV